MQIRLSPEAAAAANHGRMTVDELFVPNIGPALADYLRAKMKPGAAQHKLKAVG